MVVGSNPAMTVPVAHIVALSNIPAHLASSFRLSFFHEATFSRFDHLISPEGLALKQDMFYNCL